MNEVYVIMVREGEYDDNFERTVCYYPEEHAAKEHIEKAKAHYDEARKKAQGIPFNKYTDEYDDAYAELLRNPYDPEADQTLSMVGDIAWRQYYVRKVPHFSQLDAPSASSSTPAQPPEPEPDNVIPFPGGDDDDRLKEMIHRWKSLV